MNDKLVFVFEFISVDAFFKIHKRSLLGAVALARRLETPSRDDGGCDSDRSPRQRHRDFHDAEEASADKEAKSPSLKQFF